MLYATSSISPTLSSGAIAMRYSSTDPATMEDEAGAQQSNQFGSTPMTSSPLSTNSNVRSPEEPQQPVTGAKIRKRRPPVNGPLLEPPNPYGRKGKPRCERCRN